MNSILDAFARMSFGEALGWMLAENVILFAVAILAGHLLILASRSRRIGPPPPPVEGAEIAWAASCVALNTLVTVAGWGLWRSGYIVIRRDTGARAWLDAIVLLMLMDLAMYVTHRIAHHPWAFPLAHATHHHYDRPRPLDLFVLNPIEVLGFGALWLSVLWLYTSSWLGIVIYLTLNLAFGVVGHLGVEPLPESWAGHPVLRLLGTSTFHAGHHRDDGGNFGFYTSIWDILFGTLHPRIPRLTARVRSDRPPTIEPSGGPSGHVRRGGADR
ncbi:Fatty acid hydroxylase superfamily protein [Aquisphaera giovannonii]|uniref:Fatty acid hydroxylase superfamily protein n=1 Tax=Aquisphaera giovannonii TaxID=406548 RepID=A0A5B9VSZ4_9BACT|nr:sterol desaturase family protein [Aquisphaera giovannonii]QEH31616.1 Fatty acid hydroxylase superfamily protein [Aquisphaera giovannonii]